MKKKSPKGFEKKKLILKREADKNYIN